LAGTTVSLGDFFDLDVDNASIELTGYTLAGASMGITASGMGRMMQSPDGTWWRLMIENDGTLSTTRV
jgi:hypothetical protein